MDTTAAAAVEACIPMLCAGSKHYADGCRDNIVGIEAVVVLLKDLAEA